MERLTIKELASYLPYKLQWKFEGSDDIHEVMGIDITDFGVHLFSPYGDYGKCRIYEGKPLLRPLSSLTQHEINVLRSMRFRECYQWTKTQYNYIKEVKSFPILQRYDVVEYLLKNHFDVFKLIDRGLALPIDGKEVEGE